MYYIYFFIGFLIGLGVLGFIFGFITYKRYKDISKTVEELNNFVYEEWYKHTMDIAHNKNLIKTIDDFLTIKFPDMNKTIMEKYAHVLKGKTYPQRGEDC